METKKETKMDIENEIKEMTKGAVSSSIGIELKKDKWNPYKKENLVHIRNWLKSHLTQVDKEVLDILQRKSDEDYCWLLECEDDEFVGYGVVCLNRVNAVRKFLGEEVIQYEEIKDERYQNVLSARAKKKKGLYSKK